MTGRPVMKDGPDNAWGIPIVEQVTDEERARARRAVAANATDVAEARWLLDMLGLGGR